MLEGNLSPAEVSTIETAREELQSLGESGFFDPHSNMWRLLEYVCSEYFAGQGDQLKEYSIAVAVFGKSEDFDKKRDSIVRVEAHRLRKRLDQYYRTEGANRPVMIVIPPGQYAPSFLIRHADPSPQLPPPPAVAIAKSDAPRWLAGAIGLILVLTLLGWAYERSRRTLPAVPVAAAAAVRPAGDGEAIRIQAGARSGNYVDNMGRVWSGDSFYTGGDEATTQFHSIQRTKDPTMYLKRREGDFSYHIPLRPGFYEMRLFFAETTYGEGNVEGGGETSRLMQIMANGAVLLDGFDVISDAGGPNTADIKVFKQITPNARGFLDLQFNSRRGRAFVNGIELIPGDAKKQHPIRFVARETAYVDSQGNSWLPDSYASGGRLALRQEEVTGTPDPGIYQGERYGNFNYAVPVAPGKYDVTLYFAETWHGPNRPEGGGVGTRVFDVYGNGVALLQNFDILKETGRPYAATQKKFLGMQANPQGKLIFTFVPQKNYACINAIEIVDAQK